MLSCVIVVLSIIDVPTLFLTLAQFLLVMEMEKGFGTLSFVCNFLDNSTIYYMRK